MLPCLVCNLTISRRQKHRTEHSNRDGNWASYLIYWHTDGDHLLQDATWQYMDGLQLNLAQVITIGRQHVINDTLESFVKVKVMPRVLSVLEAIVGKGHFRNHWQFNLENDRGKLSEVEIWWEGHCLGRKNDGRGIVWGGYKTVGELSGVDIRREGNCPDTTLCEVRWLCCVSVHEAIEVVGHSMTNNCDILWSKNQSEIAHLLCLLLYSIYVAPILLVSI